MGILRNIAELSSDKKIFPLLFCILICYPWFFFFGRGLKAVVWMLFKFLRSFYTGKIYQSLVNVQSFLKTIRNCVVRFYKKKWVLTLRRPKEWVIISRILIWFTEMATREEMKSLVCPLVRTLEVWCRTRNQRFYKVSLGGLKLGEKKTSI